MEYGICECGCEFFNTTITVYHDIKVSTKGGNLKEIWQFASKSKHQPDEPLSGWFVCVSCNKNYKELPKKGD